MIAFVEVLATELRRWVLRHNPLHWCQCACAHPVTSGRCGPCRCGRWSR